MIQELGAALLDFVYPPSCLACGRGMEEAGEYLCRPCWEEIGKERQRRCQRCGCPLEGDPEDCPNCAEWDPVFERAVVLGRFEGAMQLGIHALKFKHHEKLGVEMGRRMGERMKEDLERVELLVPVPLHPARQRERGYNQSFCVALGLGEALGVRVDDSLVKRRVNTRQQAKLDAQQRQENLRDSFCISGPLPDCGCIGLVDDVLTTGATLDACARVLMEGGAGRVWAVTLASPFRES